MKKLKYIPIVKISLHVEKLEVYKYFYVTLYDFYSSDMVIRVFTQNTK